MKGTLIWMITCADTGIGVQHLHWTSWTPKLASGYGTFWERHGEGPPG